MCSLHFQVEAGDSFSNPVNSTLTEWTQQEQFTLGMDDKICLKKANICFIDMSILLNLNSESVW